MNAQTMTIYHDIYYFDQTGFHHFLQATTQQFPAQAEQVDYLKQHVLQLIQQNKTVQSMMDIYGSWDAKGIVETLDEDDANLKTAFPFLMQFVLYEYLRIEGQGDGFGKVSGIFYYRLLEHPLDQALAEKMIFGVPYLSALQKQDAGAATHLIPTEIWATSATVGFLSPDDQRGIQTLIETHLNTSPKFDFLQAILQPAITNALKRNDWLCFIASG